MLTIRFDKWDFASLLHRFCAYCARTEAECGEAFDLDVLYFGDDQMLTCRRFERGGKT